MKKIILLAALFIATFSAKAQIADGSIAPDFTATDINGVEWNLYDILDQGKSVILDVSATWCGPCWNYHTSGILEDVWSQYGPDGTDEMFIFMIEGDASTNVDCIYGQANCNGTSLGDWTAGVEYPIIDAAEIANAYQIAYYPTLFIICPDKIVTEVGQVSAAQHYASHGNCPEWVTGTNNAAISSYTGTGNVQCGTESDIVPSLTIQNLGDANLTSATVTLSVDGSLTETVDWTGDLATLESDIVSFSSVTVSSSAEFAFEVTNPNGLPDDFESNNVLTEVLGAQRTTAEVTFEITTDFWPEEIHWQLKDDAGTTLYSDLDEGALSCDNSYSQVYNLEAGNCYTFSVQDDYGDGILNGPVNPSSHACGTPNGQANQAMGVISLSSDIGVIWDDIDYGDGFEVEFLVIDPNAVEELALEDLKVFPNPATEQVNLTFGIAETSRLQVNVYNMMGQIVSTVGTQSYAAGNHSLELNTAGLATGMYFVSITDGTAIVTEKLTVVK